MRKLRDRRRARRIKPVWLDAMPALLLRARRHCSAVPPSFALPAGYVASEGALIAKLDTHDPNLSCGKLDARIHQHARAGKPRA
jgi:hypothetical protein